MSQFELKPFYRRMVDVIDSRLTVLEICRSRLANVGCDGAAAVVADEYDRHVRVKARLNGRKMFRGDFPLRRRAALLVKRGKR